MNSHPYPRQTRCAHVTRTADAWWPWQLAARTDRRLSFADCSACCALQASEDHTGEDLEKILSAVGAGESAPAAGGGPAKKDNVGTEASVPTSKSSNAANGDARPSAKGSHHSAAGGAAADGGGDRLQEKADDLISQLKKGASGSGDAKDGNGEGGGDDLASMADSFRDDPESDDLGGLGMVMASMQGVKGETMSDEQKRNFVATLGAALSS